MEKPRTGDCGKKTPLRAGSGEHTETRLLGSSVPRNFRIAGNPPETSGRTDYEQSCSYFSEVVCGLSKIVSQFEWTMGKSPTFCPCIASVSS
jgi:hypothetical protein